MYVVCGRTSAQIIGPLRSSELHHGILPLFNWLFWSVFRHSIVESIHKFKYEKIYIFMCDICFCWNVLRFLFFSFQLCLFASCNHFPLFEGGKRILPKSEFFHSYKCYVVRNLLVTDLPFFSSPFQIVLFRCWTLIKVRCFILWLREEQKHNPNQHNVLLKPIFGRNLSRSKRMLYEANMKEKKSSKTSIATNKIKRRECIGWAGLGCGWGNLVWPNIEREEFILTLFHLRSKFI